MGLLGFRTCVAHKDYLGLGVLGSPCSLNAGVLVIWVPAAFMVDWVEKPLRCNVGFRAGSKLESPGATLEGLGRKPAGAFEHKPR